MVAILLVVAIESWSEFDEWSDFLWSPAGDSFAERIAALRPPWMRQAACSGADPDLFFPDRTTAAEAIPAARAICSAYPVSAQCRAHAVAEPAIRGLWGGTSERDRSRIRRRRDRAA